MGVSGFKAGKTEAMLPLGGHGGDFAARSGPGSGPNIESSLHEGSFQKWGPFWGPFYKGAVLYGDLKGDPILENYP